MPARSLILTLATNKVRCSPPQAVQMAARDKGDAGAPAPGFPLQAVRRSPRGIDRAIMIR